MRQESGGPVRVDVGGREASCSSWGRTGPCGSCTSRVTPPAISRCTTSAPARCSAATAFRARSTSDSTGAPMLCPTYTHVDDYLATASQIESLAPRELHGCHWPAARGDEVAAFIAETRDYVEHVDGLVRGCLAEPLTLDALVACVNRRLDAPWPDEIAPELVYSVHGHAERLVAPGAATSSPRPRRPPGLPGGEMRITRIDTVRTEEFPNLVHVLVHTSEGAHRARGDVLLRRRGRGAHPRRRRRVPAGRGPVADRAPRRHAAWVRRLVLEWGGDTCSLRDRHRAVGSTRQDARAAVA